MAIWVSGSFNVAMNLGAERAGCKRPAQRKSGGPQKDAKEMQLSDPDRGGTA